MLHLNDKGYNFNDKDATRDPLEELKWLLSAEVTSLNSFENCLNTPAAASFHSVSMACCDLHAMNVHLLSQRLADLGVEVENGTDLWHSFLELLGSAASAFGAEALLDALRKHEMALLSEYETKVGAFDSENLLLLQEQLIPNQVKVCELLGGIRHEDDVSEAVASTDMPVNLSWA